MDAPTAKGPPPLGGLHVGRGHQHRDSGEGHGSEGARTWVRGHRVQPRGRSVHPPPGARPEGRPAGRPDRGGQPGDMGRRRPPWASRFRDSRAGGRVHRPPEAPGADAGHREPDGGEPGGPADRVDRYDHAERKRRISAARQPRHPDDPPRGVGMAGRALGGHAGEHHDGTPPAGRHENTGHLQRQGGIQQGTQPYPI